MAGKIEEAIGALAEAIRIYCGLDAEASEFRWLPSIDRKEVAGRAIVMQVTPAGDLVSPINRKQIEHVTECNAGFIVPLAGELSIEACQSLAAETAEKAVRGLLLQAVPTDNFGFRVSEAEIVFLSDRPTANRLQMAIAVIAFSAQWRETSEAA